MGAATSEMNGSTVRERGDATCTRWETFCTLRRVALRSRVRPRLFAGAGGPTHHAVTGEAVGLGKADLMRVADEGEVDAGRG